MKVQFTYNVSDEDIRHELAETASPGGRSRTALVSLDELSRVARQLVADVVVVSSYDDGEDGEPSSLLGNDGEPRGIVEVRLGTYQAARRTRGAYLELVPLELSAVPDLAGIEAALAVMAASRPSAEAEVERLSAEDG